MKRFLTNLSIITFVIITNSCSTEEFDLISDRNTITIYYTTTDKDIVKVNNNNIISNTYTDEIGTIIINGEPSYIDNLAFKDCKNLKSITIPNNVKEIGDSAFYGCSGLTSVTIGNSVASIGGHAFYNCSGLTSVTIGNSVASIGGHAFYNCSGLTAVHITDLVAWCNIDFENYLANPLCYAKNLCLNGELVTELVIPDDVAEIKPYAFYNCSGLTSIEIPNSVTIIGKEAFNGCTFLKELRFEDGTKTLSLGYNNYSYSYDGKGLFYGCPLETLYLGRDLSYDTDRSYGYSPFYNNSTLESVTIGNSVTRIGDYAFNSCSGLTSVTIGKKVASIGEYAFAYCKDLADVYCLATTVPSTTADTFKGSYPLNTLHVPADLVEYYSVKSPWSGFGTIEALIN